MYPTTSTGSVASLMTSLRTLGERFLALLILECRQAGQSLAWMVGLALIAGVLLITGWLALLACIVLLLVHHQIVGWGWALAIAALLSFAGAGGLIFLAVRQSRHLRFAVTLRQLKQTFDGGSCA
ncbi:MAG: phage holin family protein [Candidatus Accumulibacter sp. UW26]|jgi:hypothetical protein